MKKCDIFVVGVLVGTVAALLLTEKTGTERRQDLVECQEKVINKTNELIDTVKASDIYSDIVK
ncbi:MAG: YtxH domain-containing protein [Mycoplasmatales bacterium]